MSKKRLFVAIVDDDLSVREGIARLIRSAGLNVESYGSAQEFLASLQDEAPSCLVLDVGLPGLSGLELQQQLAKADIHIPTIFLSGRGDIQMSVRAINAGALYFFTKPFHEDELLDAIQCIVCGEDSSDIPKKSVSESPVINISDGRGTRAVHQDRANPVLLMPKFATAI